jgi:glucose uptake protein GlcU|tara:strand:- start:2638 stop:2829 length:192 start_codon:yes stop_codon:yes gene_type:complete
MHTLAHIAGTLGMVYLVDFSFTTLDKPVLGFCAIALVLVGVLFTALTAFQEAEFMRDSMKNKN